MLFFAILAVIGFLVYEVELLLLLKSLIFLTIEYILDLLPWNFARGLSEIAVLFRCEGRRGGDYLEGFGVLITLLIHVMLRMAECVSVVACDDHGNVVDVCEDEFQLIPARNII